MTVGNDIGKPIKSKVTQLQIKLKTGDYSTIEANVVPVISAKVQRKSIDIESTSDMKYLVSTLELADPFPTSAEGESVDLLVEVTTTSTLFNLNRSRPVQDCVY